jgi:hypothetical protein
LNISAIALKLIQPAPGHPVPPRSDTTYIRNPLPPDQRLAGEAL